jgi:hypothetical protein
LGGLAVGLPGLLALDHLALLRTVSFEPSAQGAERARSLANAVVGVASIKTNGTGVAVVQSFDFSIFQPSYASV